MKRIIIILASFLIQACANTATLDNYHNEISRISEPENFVYRDGFALCLVHKVLNDDGKVNFSKDKEGIDYLVHEYGITYSTHVENDKVFWDINIVDSNDIKSQADILNDKYYVPKIHIDLISDSKFKEVTSDNVIYPINWNKSRDANSIQRKETLELIYSRISEIFHNKIKSDEKIATRKYIDSIYGVDNIGDVSLQLAGYSMHQGRKVIVSTVDYKKSTARSDIKINGYILNDAESLLPVMEDINIIKFDKRYKIRSNLHVTMQCN